PVLKRLQVQRTTEHIIALGASTGGTEAIRSILRALSNELPGIVIAQHIPEVFSTAFAKRLDSQCSLRVVEARQGDSILQGHVYIAPGNAHLEVRRRGAHYCCHVSKDPPVNMHRPSIDVLFDSVADAAGSDATGVLLTGMGADGAAGLLKLREGGAYTIAQDQASSVVWGMPRQAIERDAACEVLSIEEIIDALSRRVTPSSGRSFASA
ncbi:MAG: CheB methylesterase domain-containing protein, partial [Myxococcota bacterium]